MCFPFEKDVFKYSIKRSDRVKILPSKTYVKLSSKGYASTDFYLLSVVWMASQGLQPHSILPISAFWENNISEISV